MGKKGQPKTGGRKAGTPNKDTQTLQDICAKHDLDVFEGMVVIAKECVMPMQRFGLFAELAQYLYPKRKAIEMDASVNLELARQAEEFAALPKAEQIRLAEAELKRLKGGK